MVYSKPEGRLICNVKSVPWAILFLFVALQRGVSTGDSFAISGHTEQSPVYPWGGLPFEIMWASFHTFKKVLLQKKHCGVAKIATGVFRDFIVGLYLSAFYPLNFLQRMNGKHNTTSQRSLLRIQSLEKENVRVMQWRLTEEKQPLSTSDRQSITSAAPPKVLLDFFKFITVDWKSNGDVRKQRPPGTCTTSFRFNTAICFRVPRNSNISA